MSPQKIKYQILLSIFVFNIMVQINLFNHFYIEQKKALVSRGIYSKKLC